MAPGLTIRITCLMALLPGVLLLAGGPARAESTPPTENMPSVTIEAQADLEKRVQTYVRKITSSSRFQRESLARWNKALCFEVAGLPKRDAEFMVWRLTKIALSVGAHVQARECTRRKANFYVVFTPDPAKTLKYLKWHPKLLFDCDANIAQINKFLADSTPLPVRVWHNGSNIGQLSDYTAMAGLVDLDINAGLEEAPTILRLFTQAEGSRPQGLSAWDQAFLSATYHTDPKSVDQRGAIARVVARDLLR